jgi:hypothetical protein
VTNGEKAWRLEKRFSDFEELHRQLLYLPLQRENIYRTFPGSLTSLKDPHLVTGPELPGVFFWEDTAQGGPSCGKSRRGYEESASPTSKNSTAKSSTPLRV